MFRLALRKSQLQEVTSFVAFDKPDGCLLTNITLTRGQAAKLLAFDLLSVLMNILSSLEERIRLPTGG